MVGSAGGDSRSKDAIGMMALHEALRNVCLNSDWTYSVFWTIRPRPYSLYYARKLFPFVSLVVIRLFPFFLHLVIRRSRGVNVCKVVGDDNGTLMLMWEDGFCRTSTAECMEEEDTVRKVFSKMSIQLYNYGEGLMGKVASDKCHKWVFKEPSDQCEASISNYWQSSFDSLPPEWTDQFASGIQTIAVIQAGHGLLQLGSCKIIAEDLHFVLRMRHMFESLGHQSGFFLSQLFSSRNSSTASSVPFKHTPAPNPPLLYNWNHYASLNSSSIYQPSPHGGSPNNKDVTLLFLPRASGAQLEEPEPDVRWPNGLSFFSALTGTADDAKLLFNSEVMGEKIDAHQHSPANLYGNGDEVKGVLDASSIHGNGGDAVLGVDNTEEDFLSLESHSGKAAGLGRWRIT